MSNPESWPVLRGVKGLPEPCRRPARQQLLGHPGNRHHQPRPPWSTAPIWARTNRPGDRHLGNGATKAMVRKVSPAPTGARNRPGHHGAVHGGEKDRDAQVVRMAGNMSCRAPSHHKARSSAGLATPPSPRLDNAHAGHDHGTRLLSGAPRGVMDCLRRPSLAQG